MQIEIQNFRCIKKYNTHFSLDTWLIAGENGRGKSTLLYAIYWCLYGEKKNVTTFGKNSTLVRIIFPQITIERTKPPNNLRVTLKGGTSETFENEIAQGYIDSFMGCSKDIFDVACYIRQKHRFSSLLTHNDSSYLLEKMTDKGNIDMIIEKLKHHLRYLKSEKETHEKMVVNCIEPEFCEQPEKMVDENDVQSHQSKISKKRGRLYTLTTMIEDHLEIKRKNSIYREKRKTIQTRIDFLEREIKKYSKTVNYDLYKEYFEAENTYGLLSNARKEELKKLTSQLVHDPAELQEKIDSIQKEIDLGTSNNTKRVEYSKKIKDLYFKIQRAIGIDLGKNVYEGIQKLDSIKTRPLKINCPCCEAAIYYDGKKASKSPPKSDDGIDYYILAGLKKEIDELKMCYDNLPEEVELTNLYEQKGKLLTEFRKASNLQTMIELKKEPSPTEKKLKSILDAGIDVSREEYEKGRESYTVARELLTQYKKELATLKRELKLCSEEVFENSSALIDEKSTLENELELLDEEHSLLTSLYGETIRYREYLEQKKSFDELSSNNDMVKKKIKKITREIDLTTSILEKAEIAAVDVSTDLIGLINKKAKVHLKNLFDYPLKVELESKDTKLKIGLKIECRGIELPDLESLGGGEKERVELAFCLALNEIGNSKKILMFDESFSGVHTDAFIKSIEYIKSIYKNIIILVVSQHGNEGCFDSILRI